MTIIAAADGSALGNPGPAGWAWYVDPSRWASGGWPHGTNNMGELMAVLDLLRSTAHVDEPLLVYCDSRYVIDSITKWMPGWKKKGWKKKDGKPVLNVDLMKQLDAAMAGRDVTFEWVKGHSGHHLNEEADRLANAAALAHKEGCEPEPGPGWPGAQESPEALVEAHHEEEDLFSAVSDTPVEEPAEALAEEPAAEPEPASEPASEPDPETDSEGSGGQDPLATVLASERELLSDDVRRDPAALTALLHPDWSLVGDSGQVWTRPEWVARVGPIGEVRVEVLRSEQVDDDTVLLVWRGHDRIGTAVHSTWWVRAGERWVQRFHHVSRTSG